MWAACLLTAAAAALSRWQLWHASGWELVWQLLTRTVTVFLQLRIMRRLLLLLLLHALHVWQCCVNY
jgi:hypothetical protein